MLYENGRSPDGGGTGFDGVNLLSLGSYRQRMIRNRIMGIVFQNPHLGLKMHISSGGNIAERLLAAGWREVKRRESA